MAFTIKAYVPLAKTVLTFHELRNAWLMPTYDLMNSLIAPSTAAKKLQLLSFAIKFVQLLADLDGAAGTFKTVSKTWGNFRVLIPRHVSDTILYQCSCEAYHRDLACSHALAMGIQKDGVQILEDRSL